MTESNFATWGKTSTEDRLIPTLPQRLGNKDTIFQDEYISEGALWFPWERHSCIVKLARGFLKDLYLKGME